MGDVIHALPALTDAKSALKDIQFDWVVEPGFSEIPRWHQAVNEVLSVPLRKWRKQPWQTFKSGEWKPFIERLRKVKYDAVIDAQGLFKSALITRMAKGKRIGPCLKSAKESLASLFYQRTVKVDQLQHAVQRSRKLFAQALHYPLPETPPDYGIDRSRLMPLSYGDKTILFLHGTTWTTKHWPADYWRQLGVLVSNADYQVLLPWGNDIEHERAQSIYDFVVKRGFKPPVVLPKLNLGELTTLIAKAKGIVAVDTGLGHIAAAMATPTVSLYGPTDPDLTGAYGPWQEHLRAQFPCAPCFGRTCQKGENFAINPPCFETIPPEKVWDALNEMMINHKAAIPHAHPFAI